MSLEDDKKFFELRKEGKTYISKLFTWNVKDEVGKRNVSIVFNNSDELKLGEVNGALCLRLDGRVRKTQVTAIVTQDENKVKRVTLQTFRNRSKKGEEWFSAVDKDEFTFRGEEFARLLEFLNQLKFVDLSNKSRFQIEDISTESGPKVIVDAKDQDILAALRELSDSGRESFLSGLREELSADDISSLLGRKDALQTFSDKLKLGEWSERQWQDFFDREQWVFGYGLDYRIMRPFDRELNVGAGGTDNKEKPFVDFLQTFTDYSVLVEIKLP